MDRLKLWVGCALVAFGLLATARPAHAQTAYIPGNKFDYLINGMRSPTYSSPRYSTGYPAANSDYYSGYYATRPEYVVPANAAPTCSACEREVWLSDEKAQQTGGAQLRHTAPRRSSTPTASGSLDEREGEGRRGRKVAVQRRPPEPALSRCPIGGQKTTPGASPRFAFPSHFRTRTSCPSLSH